MGVSMNVKISGPLFDKDIRKAVEDAVFDEVMQKVEERMERSARTTRSKGRTLIGQQRNTVRTSSDGLQFVATSTLNNPRNKGTSWVKKHIGAAGFGKGILGSMIPHVARKAGKRIAGDLG